MFKCEICGKIVNKKIRYGGYTLCSKHMHQLHSHGKFLDNCPRTQNDLNEYRIEGDIAIGGLYDGVTSEQIDEFIIDSEDLEKVRYHKWRFSHSHIVTGLPAQGTQRELSWVVLGLDNRIDKNIIVDHINCNPKDNRKSNLRICQQAENVRNKSFMTTNTSGLIGVSFRKNRGTWDPEIRRDGQRCHLGATKDFQEAVFKRYYAEQLVFGEFANQAEQEKKKEYIKTIPQEKQEQLKIIVEKKLKEKNLWQ